MNDNLCSWFHLYTLKRRIQGPSCIFTVVYPYFDLNFWTENGGATGISHSAATNPKLSICNN